jgi:hypothetical protein
VVDHVLAFDRAGEGAGIVEVAGHDPGAQRRERFRFSG